jgi:hypothetical protein
MRCETHLKSIGSKRNLAVSQAQFLLNIFKHLTVYGVLTSAVYGLSRGLAWTSP